MILKYFGQFLLLNPNPPQKMWKILVIENRNLGRVQINGNFCQCFAVFKILVEEFVENFVLYR